jgi:O-antigen/teichoic acid export membrane protein
MTMVSVIACLRFDQAIPLVTSRAASSALVLLSLGLATATGVLTAGILFVVTQLSDRLAEAIPYPLVISVGIVLLAVNNIAIMWATGRRMINSMAAARLVSSIADAAFKITFGTIAATGAALLGAYLLGLTVTIVFFLILFIMLGALPRLQWGNVRRRLGYAIFRHRRFFQLGLLETVFTTVAMQAPVLLFASLFGPAQAALLFLALQIMRGPVTLISNAAGRVFLSQLASARKNQNVEDLTREHLSILARTGIPLVILLGFTGSALASRIFGSNYADLSYYMLCMVPWMTMVMLTTPFTAALYSYERFGLALFLALLGAILRVGSVLLCFVLGLDPVLMLAVASITIYLVYMVAISRTIGLRARGWFQPLLGGAPRMIAASAVGIMILVAEGTVY